MMLRTAIKLVGDEFDQLAILKVAAEDGSPNEIVNVEESLRLLAERTESDFLAVTSSDLHTRFDEARQAVGEVEHLRQTGSISPDAAVFLSAIYENLVSRAGRLISG